MSGTGRIYLMTVAATGKSRFASLHASYRGHAVVDFAQTMPRATLAVKLLLYIGRRVRWIGRLARRSEFVQAKQRDRYHRDIFAFIRSRTEPTIVLGRPGPDDLSQYTDVTFAAVLIPWDQHVRNCASRRSGLRNPLPAFDHWSTNVEHIRRLRQDLIDYAEAHDIAVYTSFDEALDALIATPVPGEGAVASGVTDRAVSSR